MYRAKHHCRRDVFLNSNCPDSSGQFFYVRGNICRCILRNMYIFSYLWEKSKEAVQILFLIKKLGYEKVAIYIICSSSDV